MTIFDRIEEIARIDIQKGVLEIGKFREEIIIAFIAKYGCEPDQVCFVEKWDGGTCTFYVTQKKDVKLEQKPKEKKMAKFNIGDRVRVYDSSVVGGSLGVGTVSFVYWKTGAYKDCVCVNFEARDDGIYHIKQCRHLKKKYPPTNWNQCVWCNDISRICQIHKKSEIHHETLCMDKFQPPTCTIEAALTSATTEGIHKNIYERIEKLEQEQKNQLNGFQQMGTHYAETNIRVDKLRAELESKIQMLTDCFLQHKGCIEKLKNCADYNDLERTYNRIHKRMDTIEDKIQTIENRQNPNFYHSQEIRNK